VQTNLYVVVVLHWSFGRTKNLEISPTPSMVLSCSGHPLITSYLKVVNVYHIRSVRIVNPVCLERNSIVHNYSLIPLTVDCRPVL
jgi:hypothetical protein